MVYRVYREPFLEIFESHQDFRFQIEAYNGASSLLSDPINVTVVNTNEEIIPTKEFNETDLTIE